MILPAAKEKGAGVVLGAPLQQGRLAVPHREWLQKPPEWMDEDLRGRFERLYAIHDETGLSLADLAVRFLLADPDFSTVIPGPSTVGQLEENIQSAAACFFAGSRMRRIMVCSFSFAMFPPRLPGAGICG